MRHVQTFHWQVASNQSTSTCSEKDKAFTQTRRIGVEEKRWTGPHRSLSYLVIEFLRSTTSANWHGECSPYFSWSCNWFWSNSWQAECSKYKEKIHPFPSTSLSKWIFSIFCLRTLCRFQRKLSVLTLGADSLHRCAVRPIAQACIHLDKAFFQVQRDGSKASPKFTLLRNRQRNAAYPDLVASTSAILKFVWILFEPCWRAGIMGWLTYKTKLPEKEICKCG